MMREREKSKVRMQRLKKCMKVTYTSCSHYSHSKVITNVAKTSLCAFCSALLTRRLGLLASLCACMCLYVLVCLCVCVSMAECEKKIPVKHTKVSERLLIADSVHKNTKNCSKFCHLY